MAEHKKEYQWGFQIRIWDTQHRKNLQERSREKKTEAETTREGFLAHTFAVAAIWCQLEPGFANTLETAIFINAHPIQAHVPYAALIHVWKQRHMFPRSGEEGCLDEYNSDFSHFFLIFCY